MNCQSLLFYIYNNGMITDSPHTEVHTIHVMTTNSYLPPNFSLRLSVPGLSCEFVRKDLGKNKINTERQAPDLEKER